MKTPVVADMLTHVARQSRDRLDRLADGLPADTTRQPFENYMAQAQRAARANPEFSQELRRALHQYRAIGG